ncbi:MAG TPA: FtsW/RodA/SpoVE family cell cycle protein [Lachnospiraceae bacterium]|nr:FtsW/RodA/SpoVE family cell cycle protein [Lachnospiraceae bacterium]HCE73452.1 FtsW/RodA/SpoVE family cell cycle protein [Lachnospiraceae bacterium]HCG59302.1 FtsW/RodA/SpoVE family cell cycle protein [Lachnospiraceae bacterium]
MFTILMKAAHYLILILMGAYTIAAYAAFRSRSREVRERLFLRQDWLLLGIHFLAYLTMYLKTLNTELLLFYAAQLIYFLFVLLLFRNLYPRISKGLLNNMCLLVMTGFVMITRLSYDESVRQFRFACIGTGIALIVPVIIRKLHLLTKMSWAYAFVGIGLLGLVMVASRSVNGAKLTLTVGGFAFQPSEFVKIIFVFAVAGLLAGEHSLKRIITATVLAAVHVGILVISTDLGSALIFFVTYLVMLFVATRNPFLVSIGVLAGAAAAVAAYFLFSHVRVRVQIWKDPFADYAGSGYQICQSLFSIAAGGWLGTGLYRGSPGAIPYVEEDFMFSAILEEMGGIFGICLILVCLAVFIMFVNIAMKLESRFYRLAAVGFGAIYATQVFLTIGGGTKLIPMTGVTLPLVSYGGSSLLSTLIMIAIVQGLYMLRSDEVREEYETERSRISEPGQPYRD